MSSHIRPETITMKGVSDVSGAARRAAEVLDRGGLLQMPTETLYGIAARADLPDAVRALAIATNRPVEALGSSWHLPGDGKARAIATGGFAAALHRRAIERLTPGPVRVAFDVPDAWPLGRGIADDGRKASIRIVQDPLAWAVLSLAGGPVVINRAGPDARTPAAISGIELTLDAGPTMYGRPATGVMLGRSPAGAPTYSVEGGNVPGSVGAMEERVIHRRMQRTILFACTGNTCRSPMAMAIASDLLSKASPESLGHIPTVSASAGVSAVEGDPASRENGPALRALGIPMPVHRSTRLTAGMIADAEVVYVMTQAHARAVRSIAGPGLSGEAGDTGKIRLLDPAGDVEDPFGGTQRMYDELAKRLRDLVAERLAEWTHPPEP